MSTNPVNAWDARLLAASEVTYDAVRYLGAAYLIGIGIYKLFFEKPGPCTREATTKV